VNYSKVNQAVALMVLAVSDMVLLLVWPEFVLVKCHIHSSVESHFANQFQVNLNQNI
jgi:uncharacterized membrane protein